MESTLTDTQQKILRVLVADTSAKRTITGAELAKRIGFIRRPGEDKGGMRQVIHALRRKRFPICASNRGYFYARTDAELAKFIGKMQARLIAQEEALRGLKEAFHNVGKVSDGGKVQYFKRLPVRVSPGVVRMQEFPIGPDGKAVIPEGVETL